MEAASNLAPSRHRSSRASEGALAHGVLVASGFSAGIHIALAPEHLRESPLLGLGFLVSAALLLALGLGTYMRPGSVRFPLLTTLTCAALIAAYVASRTVGLPVLQPAPEAVDAAGVVTKAVEFVALVLSLHLLFANAAGSSRCLEKRRTRWTTISRLGRAGS